MKIWGYRKWSWCWQWFYTRRANRLRMLHDALGYDFAVEYGRRRNWIHSYDGEKIYLAGPGRELP